MNNKFGGAVQVPVRRAGTWASREVQLGVGEPGVILLKTARTRGNEIGQGSVCRRMKSTTS